MSEITPSMFVINKINQKRGIGLIQTSINNKITINFEHVGKKVINIKEIKLKILKNYEIN